ncbi:MAG: transglycosylase SLT domain-containing protein, partial [Gammaproteobacteria bacterium]
MQWYRFVSLLSVSLIINSIALAQPASTPVKSGATAKQTTSITKAKVKSTPKSTHAVAHYSNNMWALIASNFSLSHYANSPEVQRQIDWFQRNPKYFIKIANQGQPYMYYIYQQVKKRGLPGELVLLPMIESAYDPFAYSWVGAAGLWQMMPATGSNFGLKQDWWYDGRKDIVSSTDAALDYLTYLET